jgi:hypothetical protein
MTLYRRVAGKMKYREEEIMKERGVFKGINGRVCLCAYTEDPGRD